uniref:Protein SDA1 n=1 Tax=Albugo laibachii Nc14 TaxID=890382 RepID=F0WX60_9STRA|nr:SDA1 family protein putative [Albugo laibachii Nc14]|eukprot:CCA26051.1 SDA1 family protein putative [Albugo laibachii Nc14]
MATTIQVSRPDVIGKLPQLQNMIKRDPEAYKTEFLMQYRHYESEYQLFLLQPCKDSTHFSALISFLSHVARCFPTEMGSFPTQLVSILRNQYLVLDPPLRKTLVQSLVLLCSHKLMDAIVLLKLLFELFRCPDKRLRDLVHKYILAEIRKLNAKSSNVKVNRAIQNFLYEMIQDEHEQAAIKSLQIMIELYQKHVWHDTKTVNVIVTACTSKNTKLAVMAMKFFLGMEFVDEEEPKADPTGDSTAKVDYHSHSKKTKKRLRETKNAISKVRRARKEKAGIKTNVCFPAIELLNDPQGIIEKQFRMLKNSIHRFEVRLLMMNFISRIVGHYKLIIIPFYSLVQRYLQSHQQNVTSILAYLVQACHDDIPPDEVLQVVKSIATNFITERCSSEVIAVGINALREIFRRVPLLLECEDMEVFTSDLIMYSKAKDKGVVMAARGVLNLIRECHPTLLRRKDRGKHHDRAARPRPFGESTAVESVDGAELLAAAEASGRFSNVEDSLEVKSGKNGSDSDSESWLDVESGDEEDQQHESIEAPENEDRQCIEDIATDPETIIKVSQSDQIDARRILTPLDFERIEILKRERAENSRDPKNRSKKRQQTNKTELTSGSSAVAPNDLAGYTKKRRMTQEERLRSILKGREDFQHKRSSGGTTNTEKKRLKHFMMIKKSKRVQSKVLKSAREIQHSKNRLVKKEITKLKKRRKI